MLPLPTGLGRRGRKALRNNFESLKIYGSPWLCNVSSWFGTKLFPRERGTELRLAGPSSPPSRNASNWHRATPVLKEKLVSFSWRS